MVTSVLLHKFIFIPRRFEKALIVMIENRIFCPEYKIKGCCLFLTLMMVEPDLRFFDVYSAFLGVWEQERKLTVLPELSEIIPTYCLVIGWYDV